MYSIFQSVLDKELLPPLVIRWSKLTPTQNLHDMNIYLHSEVHVPDDLLLDALPIDLLDIHHVLTDSTTSKQCVGDVLPKQSLSTSLHI